jgi:hypothetical protein
MPKAQKAAPTRPNIAQSFTDGLTHERLLANAERARWQASGPPDEVLRGQLLAVAARYDAMAKALQ